MKLSTFFRLSVPYYQTGKCFYMLSGVGRGKTSTVNACVPHISAALGKNLGLSVLMGPNMNPSDVQGYMVPKHIEPTNGSQPRAESFYTDPPWWRTTEGKRLEEYDGGIIFIDEVDKADTDVKKQLGEMAYSGRLGSHILPPGWVVWMAGNRQSDRSGSTKELDHLINRRGQIEIEDDLVGLEQWMIKQEIHPAIISFAVQNSHIVFPDGAPEKQGPFCTPRSLVAAGEVLVTMGGKGGALPVDDDAVETAAAFIGQAAAAQLFATIRLDTELPPLDTIINSPGTAKLPGAPDAQMLVCYKLASLATDITLDPIIQYIDRLPADFGGTFAKALCTRKPMFAASPAMLGWCKRNSSIMAITAML